jgi:hypothetical protein
MGLDLSGSGSYEHSHNPSDSNKSWKFLDQLSDCQRLMKGKYEAGTCSSYTIWSQKGAKRVRTLKATVSVRSRVRTA